MGGERRKEGLLRKPRWSVYFQRFVYSWGREQPLKCVWDGTTGRENFVSCSHSWLYNRALNLARLCDWVCKWVGSSAGDSQSALHLSLTSWRPGRQFTSGCSQELVEDYLHLETFMEFTASSLALYTGITSASAVIHTSVNISFLNTEVRPKGLLLPVGVIGRFWTCQCMLAGWNILRDKREECAAVCLYASVSQSGH